MAGSFLVGSPLRVPNTSDGRDRVVDSPLGEGDPSPEGGGNGGSFPAMPLMAPRRWPIQLTIAVVALLWHDCGMPRVRVSTTVDQRLLDEARRLRADINDAGLIDEALAALLAQHRVAEIDAAYGAYDAQPLDQRDEWGDLASFREAAGSS